MSKPVLMYTSLIIGVALWWGIVFYPRSSPEVVLATTHSSLVLESKPLERSQVLRALQGDSQLIAALLLQWDIEAQHNATERLASEKILRAHYLSQLKRAPSKERFLPQTYVAASLLLALVQPEQIVALPTGLRHQTALYDPHLTARIPLDNDRYCSESLYLLSPKVAFVSDCYTHPATLQALRQQGIALSFQKNPENLQAVRENIQLFGKVCGEPEKAELLQLFMEGSFLHLDNLVRGKKRPDIFFVNYYGNFYLPYATTLVCDLLKRAGLYDVTRIDTTSQCQALTLEKLKQWENAFFIISIQPSLQNTIKRSEIKALREGRYLFLDDDLLETASHYAVLAYYDLVHALLQLEAS